MANIKFTQLPNQATVTDTTILPTVSAGTNYTITGANLKTYVNSTTGNVTAGNVLTTGLVSAAGNISGAYFIGNGSLLTGLPATYGNADVSNYLASGTDLGNIISQGNVAAAYIIGNGSALTNLNIGPALTTYTGNITGGNISVSGNVYGNIRNATGGYSDSNVQSILQTYSGSMTTGTLSATGNITAPYFVGNGSALTGVTASLGGTMISNIAGAGYSITGLGSLTASGNISGTFIGSGSQLTGIPTSILAGSGISVSASTGAVTITNNNPTPYTNANVAAYLPTYTGNLTAGNVAVTSAITANTVTATHLGNGAGLSNIVTSITAGSGISVNAATGAVTITATGGSGNSSSISSGFAFVNANATASTNGNIVWMYNGNSNSNIYNWAANSIVIQNHQGSVNNTIFLGADGNVNMATSGTGGGGNTFNISSPSVSIGGNLQVSGATTQVNSLSIGGGTPASSGATGSQGQIYWGTVSGTSYLYVCVATNTWRRVALTSF